MDGEMRLPWYTLLVPASQLALWCYLMYLILSQSGGTALWRIAGGALLLLCAAADGLLFRTLRKGTLLRMTVEQQRLLEASVEAQEKRGALLRREAEKASGVRRELSRQLEDAAALLKSRRIADARGCMDAAAELYPVPERCCAHPVADAILSEKLSQCRGEGIPVDCRVQIPAELGIPAAELCAVLGNLMDNAIEACRALPEGVSAGITVRGRVDGGFLVLRVENPTDGDGPVRPNGAMLDRHGWGLSIVRRIAERGGGRLTAECAEGRFVSTVWIAAGL